MWFRVPILSLLACVLAPGRADTWRIRAYTVAEGLPHIHVNDIIETRGGDYWVATDGGLTLFRPAHPTRKFVTFKPDGPPEVVFVNAVLEEPDGAVLLGTAEGLYRLRRSGDAGNFEHIDFG